LGQSLPQRASLNFGSGIYSHFDLIGESDIYLRRVPRY
jgi:hypothetical protein